MHSQRTFCFPLSQHVTLERLDRMNYASTQPFVRISHRIPTAQRERSVMFGSANPTSFVGGQALLCSVMIPASEFFESADNVLQGF